MERPKCVLYARYSDPRQKDSSIEYQVEKCEAFAESKGWEIIGVYSDKAQSGTGTERKGFLAMIEKAMSSDCPFEKIIVDSTSRIARNTRDALDFFQLLTWKGIHVYYVAQGIDTSQELAEEMITVSGLIDSIYIKNLARLTRIGVEGQVLKHYSGGGRRYGYRSEPVWSGKVDVYAMPIPEGYRWVIDREEAETVVRICRLYGEDGLSPWRIVNVLNGELKASGRPKPPRGTWWSVAAIRGNKRRGWGVLNNECYVGRYWWGRFKHVVRPDL